MSVYFSEACLDNILKRYSIYSVRQFARILGIEKPSLKTRDELITEMSNMDMSIPFNKLEIILFWYLLNASSIF